MIPYGQAVSLPPLSSLWYDTFEARKAISEETAVWMLDVEKLMPNSTAGFITQKYKKSRVWNEWSKICWNFGAKNITFWLYFVWRCSWKYCE